VPCDNDSFSAISAELLPSPASRLVKDVFVAGKLVVGDGKHAARESIATNYSKVLNQLLA